jgi:AcrR family transcriptional regulator
MAAVSTRTSLTRSRIVATATGIARAEGLAAASMRRIADELDSAPMALYRHVADREALLIAMLDDVAAAIDVPEPVEDPVAELTAILTEVHAAFRRDPWVVTVLVVDGLASPLILPVIERCLAALERAGLRGREIAAANALVWQYMYGESISMLHDRPDTFARRMSRGTEDAYPVLGRVRAALGESDPRDFFAENLARLLHGIVGAGGTGGAA